MTSALEVTDLTVRLHTPSGTVHAVDGVSWALQSGRTLAVVGESGSGKTVMTTAPLGLLPAGVSVDIDGSFRLGDDELVGMSPRRLEHLRGRAIAVVPQDPLSAMNPMRRVGSQVADGARRSQGFRHNKANRRAVELLTLVGLPDPRERARQYPHELSGGQRQRAVIAMALAGAPRVLIADEPTTALDSTVQAQIIDLLRDLQQQLGMALVLITHDIGVVSRLADDVAVMYGGRVVENGPVDAVLNRPDHPYTRGLLASLPDPEASVGERFHGLRGAPPTLEMVTVGCPFADRCPLVEDACRRHSMQLDVLGDGHQSACRRHPSQNELRLV